MLDPSDEELAAKVLGIPKTPSDLSRWIPEYEGKRVAVTGAAGSIGSALVGVLRQLPLQHLTLIDSGEAGLVQLQWSAGPDDPAQRFVYADIRDRLAIDEAFAANPPDIVFHAAALKQLPLLEAHRREAMLTNVVGSWNVLDSARSAGAATVVLVSTDKAVNPETTLGLSKRLAEGIAQWFDMASIGTRFLPVRLSNVFGSAGSVIPLWLEQMSAGQPLTITDARMKRYFLTSRQASAALLDAAVATANGSRIPQGCVILPEPGEPHAINDLALRLAERKGINPQIRITGLRAGERTEEKLHYPHERSEPIGLGILRHLVSDYHPHADFGDAIQEIVAACHSKDHSRLTSGSERALAMLQPS